MIKFEKLYWKSDKKTVPKGFKDYISIKCYKTIVLKII